MTTLPTALRASFSSLAILACSLVATQALAEAPYSFAKTPGKLPKDVVPIHYVVHLQPNLAQQEFSGDESIEIEVLKTTRKIMLNVADIEIDAASLEGKGRSAQTLVPQINPSQQTLSFALAQPLKPGRYHLRLRFHGKIYQEDRGLFSVRDASGDPHRTVLATTLEPSDARRVLPCWDEPSFRAKFSLSVDVPTRFGVWSNTPVVKDLTLPDGMHRVSFASTPKMASYLLVLVAGELERSSVTQDGVELGIIAQPGKLASGAFASASSQALVQYFNQYFGIPYPLKKLDHIALPGTIHGAMENWGGIVYHENRLLWDGKINAEDNKQGIFNIIAHETAHQWFGNLVTNAWWDNLWLNEGFASWMQAKAAAMLHPEWDSRLNDILAHDETMNLDARHSSHPIQQPIRNEEQAAAAFDSITYGKASAVLGMLESYIGEEAFRRGIAGYMRRHQYSNTTSADLWAALERASGKPVGKIAALWVTQAGLPLIKVAQRCQNGQRQITLSQQAFSGDNSPVSAKLWQIPLQLSVSGGKTETILLQQASTRIQRPGCEGLLIIDPHSQGYFRVQYDAANLQALSNQVAQLPDAVRLRLVTDSWALVQAGHLPLTNFLDLIAHFGQEPRSTVWEAILTPLGLLDKLAHDTPQQAPLQRWISQLLLPQLAQLGWDEKPGEAREQRLKRASFIRHLIQIGDAQTIAQARSRFQRYVEDTHSLRPADRNWVLSCVGMHADAGLYQQLLELGRHAKSNGERNQYYLAMFSARDPQLAAQSLQLALRDDLPTDISSRAVPLVALNQHVEQAWNFAVEHRELLLKQQGAISVNRFFPGIIQSSNQEKHAAQLEQFARQYLSEEGQIEAKRVSEGIRLKVRKKELLLPQLAQALIQAKP